MTRSTRTGAPGVVAVGWDGSGARWTTARWAAGHAARTGRDLELLHHTGDDPLGGGAGTARSAGGCDDLARARLRSLAAELRRYRPGLVVRAVTGSGELADDLLRRSERADLLVVGAPPDPHPRALGALVDHLSTSSVVPVVRVPPGCADHLGSEGGERAVLTAAVTDNLAGRAALGFALAETRRARCRWRRCPVPGPGQ